jgi:hypothetical protein
VVAAAVENQAEQQAQAVQVLVALEVQQTAQLLLPILAQAVAVQERLHHLQAATAVLEL